MEAATGKAQEVLEAELSELLERERFEPSEEFVASALVTDESLHEEAARDPEAWWAKLARDLDWFVEPSEVLDESNPPFFRWFADGKLNASLQLPRPSRGGRARRSGGVPLARRGGREAGRHLRGPSPRHPAARKRAQASVGCRPETWSVSICR